MSRSSVSLWVRDVEIGEAAWTARARANRNVGARRARPNRLREAKLAQIEELRAEGQARIGRLSEREFLVAGGALYAGEAARGIRAAKHRTGCPNVQYACARSHRLMMGLIAALLACEVSIPG